MSIDSDKGVNMIKTFMEWKHIDRAKIIFQIIDIIIMLFLLYLYLMNADLSTAPEFIYNQF